MTDGEFRDEFHRLTDYLPLSWQVRLFRDHFATGTLPSIIDLPTGLGKTMVMAIWLIARKVNKSLPRRLIYVVDRRTVVDQATDIATKLRERNEDGKLTISTLRGRLADRREWSRDLSRPAIIIGTVDLIGSALLFSGYRSGFKYRPHEAGLLGQDSLLVLDEAHLSMPFEKLITSILSFQSGQGSPMKVIRMSATTSGNESNPFKLEAADLSDPIVEERFTAKKSLSINTLGEKSKLHDQFADAAIELAQKPDTIGKRIVVFVRKPSDATEIAKAIRKHVIESVDYSRSKPKKSKHTPFVCSVKVLTGTMRGLERDELVEKPILKRFLNGDIDPKTEANQQPAFLISTSAGEVGFDLNADHMVSDATTIDSLIQRLGRVNRRGGKDRKALIQIFVEWSRNKDKDGKPKKLEGNDAAIANTLELLKEVIDVSPKDIAALKSSDAWTTVDADQRKSRYELACAPDPNTVELTDILLDAWSMTSIRDRMPGRPEVAPWLRGVAEWEPPQTTIAWRAELDQPGFADLDLDEIEEWFDTHRILPHETLAVNTTDAATWITERWKSLGEARQREIAKHPVIIDRAGIELCTIEDVVRRVAAKAPDKDAFLRGADVIIPAAFGGIRREVGLLDPAEPKLNEQEEEKTPEEQSTILNQLQQAVDVADIAPGRSRERIVETIVDGIKKANSLGNGMEPIPSARFSITLVSDDDKTIRLVSYAPRFEKPEGGSMPQSLEVHVSDVATRLKSIIQRFDEDHPTLLINDFKHAARLAAEWHDHGKNREFFQRTVGGRRSDGQRPWPSHVMGKSGGKDFGKAPRGYRHEFGSLREFADAFEAGKLLDTSGKPIPQSVFDLAMHLIASHHGRGRPHFPKGGFDPDAESRSDALHTESIRRFARLQRIYGWWTLAWLENLLRCADQLASADAETTNQDEGAGE